MTHCNPTIYFAASIRGGRDYIKLYYRMINHLKLYGTVLTEHIGSSKLEALGEDDLSDPEIHDRDLSWLFDAALVVAEVTQPSIGVGYELGRLAERRNLPPENILCLYRPQEGKRLSAMIAGSRHLTVKTYTSLNEAVAHIDSFMTSADVQKK
ncbi:MAG TPA: nucleoside 2-deoxyribosyltransferase [Candidatus Nanoarchaeia archaeon]|nr:nucleoside 2-deoxyribosyltransferase [Candidatus Nanoarchaeia archaeon]